jgi:hypothetical protein
MKATNQDRVRTTSYQAEADGVVRKDSAGKFVEEYAWSNLIRDNAAVSLSAAAASFRQILSLEPNYRLSVPDLSQVIPLVGPITDWLTIYADMLVAHQGPLSHAGDHFYFKHGTSASWADGNYVLIGEDSVDFEVTLTDINLSDQIVTLVIRHVPPAKPEIETVADWMRAPVGDTQNNWVQVSKTSDGKYVAAIGKETFDVQIRVSLVNGKIVSAAIDNPVEVLQRDCTDVALTACDSPVRYQIRRRVEVH